MVKALIFVPPDRLAEATKLIMEHLDTHIEVYFLLFCTKVLAIYILTKNYTFQEFISNDPKAVDKITALVKYLDK